MRDARYDTVILTRASEDDAALAARLRAGGARVLELHCVRTVLVEDDAPLAAAVGRLGPEDWVVITSRAGADALARAGRPTARVAAVGAATAARLARHGIAVSFVPSRAAGATLARELPAARVALLARSDRALPDLPEILRARGVEVREVVAYRTVVGPVGDVAPVREALRTGERVAIYLWSPSALDGLLMGVPRELVAGADLFVAGDTTRAAALSRLGPAAQIATIALEVMHVTHR